MIMQLNDVWLMDVVSVVVLRWVSPLLCTLLWIDRYALIFTPNHHLHLLSHTHPPI